MRPPVSTWNHRTDMAIFAPVGWRLPGRMKEDFYRKLAVYGHVGRTDLDLPREKTDKAAILADG